MISSAESVSVRRYNLHYSRTIQKIEIGLFLIVFSSLLMGSADLWLVPTLFLCILLAWLYFLKYAIFTRFPGSACIEFRANPDRLICYDPDGETSYSLEDVGVRMTRWFVLLKLGNNADQKNWVVLADSFEDMNHYTSFRRQLLLMLKRDDRC